ncbi:MAG: phage tail protein [Candidatus Aminicenantes bacterium]|nr:phage tail protein [Candidatus Aminicenantes bacterium]
MALDERKDPFLSFKFHVEIDDLIVAGFSEVSGLQAEIETEEYKEGGVNDYVHKIPKAAKYANLVLKRGITDSDVLWQWHRDAVTGNIKRKTGRIILYDFQGNEKWRWTFEDAFPVKWSGPDFKADGSTSAVESIELAHHGIKKG